MHTCECSHTQMLVRASQGCVGGIGAGCWVEEMVSTILLMVNYMEHSRCSEKSKNTTCHGLEQYMGVKKNKDKSFVGYAHFFL